MDLLRALLIYLSMVFASSVSYAPEASIVPNSQTPVAQPTPQVTAAAVKATPVPTISIVPNDSYKTLRVGDSGDRVRELQEKLAYYGYFDGEIDGRYGNQTRRAVEAFQYAHGLSADGIAGKYTLTLLYDSDEVRFAESSTAAEPTQTPDIRPAETVATPAPTEAPTEVPTAVPTEAPVETAASEITEAPVQMANIETEASKAQAELCALEGWQMQAAESTQWACDEEAMASIQLYRCDETLYLPMIDLLHALQMNTLSNETLDMNELAFPSGNAIIRITYSENKDIGYTDFHAYRDGKELAFANDILLKDGKNVLFSLECVEELMSITAVVDENGRTVTIAPAEAKE